MGNSKMNARERIDYLFDDHSFVEVGGYVSARNTDYNLGAKKVEGMTGFKVEEVNVHVQGVDTNVSKNEYSESKQEKNESEDTENN